MSSKPVRIWVLGYFSDVASSSSYGEGDSRILLRRITGRRIMHKGGVLEDRTPSAWTE
jgi:hypothetical protein